MSSSIARVLFPDGSVLHGRYNGTVDFMCSTLFDTAEERDEMWRKEPIRVAGPNRDEDVWAWADTDYADVNYPVKVCLESKRITQQWRHYPHERPILERIQQLCADGETVPKSLLWGVEDPDFAPVWEPDWDMFPEWP